MSKQNNIFIIGPTGAGKTTVGQLLAKKLNLIFYDTDIEIEKRAGMSIAQIFAIETEVGFRKREEKIITELTALTGIVLATGAGAILSTANRKLLSTNGTVIYLQASLEQQYERIKNCYDRPLLQSSNLKEVLAKMQQEREIFYESIVKYTFPTDELSIDNIIKKIISK